MHGHLEGGEGLHNEMFITQKSLCHSISLGEGFFTSFTRTTVEVRNVELGLPVNIRRRLDDLLRPLQPFILSTRQQRCCSGLLLDPMQYMRKVASPGEPSI